MTPPAHAERPLHVAEDRLRLLVHYDGIHEDKEGEEGTGAGQIAEFVADGDLMLLDWFGHLKMKDVREQASRADTPPALRAFLACMATSVKTATPGHYRDPEGRIGAVQTVEVERASEFLRLANAALNEVVLVAGSAKGPWERTVARMRAGALADRQWIFLEGHSVGISLPAHPAEWARNKAKFVEEMMKEYGKREEEANAFPVQLLAASPISLIESREGVTLRIGEPARPTTLRFRLRKGTGAGLEEAVRGQAPASVDDALADRLLGGKAAAATDVEAILEWGPPEDQVGALLSRAARTEGEAREAVLRRLAAWGEEWNQEVGIPEAPGRSGDGQEADLSAWREWYRQMVGLRRR